MVSRPVTIDGGGGQVRADCATLDVALELFWP